MFDKIFKVALLAILGFIGYTLFQLSRSYENNTLQVFGNAEGYGIFDTKKKRTYFFDGDSNQYLYVQDGNEVYVKSIPEK